jgi:hypothetical protein
MARSSKRSELLSVIGRCRSLINEGKYEKARTVGLDLLARAHAVGVAPTQVQWCLAVTADMLGDLEAAATHICAAVAGDQLAADIESSRAVIFERIRQYVRKAESDDPRVPGLYQTLLKQDEADTGAHVAWALHQHRSGHSKSALALLHATVALHPDCEEAWSLIEEIARSLGKNDLASEARAQVAALGGSLQPWTNVRAQA